MERAAVREAQNAPPRRLDDGQRAMVLDDPHVFLPSEDYQPPTPTPIPTPPPESWTYAQRVSWAWKMHYQGFYDKSLAAFIELEEYRSERADAFYGAALSLIELDRHSEAEHHLELAVQAAPKWAEPRFYMGYLAYYGGDFEEATGLLSEALEHFDSPMRGGKYSDCHWLLARSYLALGDKERAIAALEGAFLSSLPSQVGPSGLLEYTKDGSIPVANLQPLSRKNEVILETSLYYSSRGAIYSVQPEQPLTSRIPLALGTVQAGLPSPSTSNGLAQIVRLAEGASLRGPFIAIRDSQGKDRVFTERLAAPSQPVWTHDAQLLVVARSEDGQEGLYQLQPPSGQWVQLSLPKQLSHIADLQTFGTGRYLLSTPNRGHMSMAIWSGGEELKWLGDISGAPDPWSPSESDQPEASTPTPSEATQPPAPLEPMWLQDVPGMEERSEPLLMVRSATAQIEGPAARSFWNFQDEAGAPPPTPVPKAKMGPAVAASKAALAIPLAPASQGDERHGTIAPDGRIVFSRQIQGKRRLWMVDRDLEEQRALTAPGWDCYRPLFSPSGAQLLALCRKKGVAQVYNIPLTSGLPQMVFEVPEGVESMAFELP